MSYQASVFTKVQRFEISEVFNLIGDSIFYYPYPLTSKRHI